MAVTKKKQTASKPAAAAKPAAAKAYGKKSRKTLVIAILAVVVLLVPLVYGGAKDSGKRRAQVWAKNDPTNLKAHMAVLLMRRRMDQPADQIVASAQQAREKHPGDPQFEFLQGYAYALVNNKKDSTQWLNEASKHTGLSEEF